MNSLALTLLVAAQFLYYLLIAQTGIVEYFHSDLSRIFWLPLGGVVGTVLSARLPGSERQRLSGLLVLQGLISLQYPALSPMLLWSLGIVMGASAPLMIRLLREGGVPVMGGALGLSYLIGTLLFTSPAAWRGPLGIGLTLLALLLLPWAKGGRNPSALPPLGALSIATMALWAFFDSALFETLSRDASLSIWRDGYSIEIAACHFAGVLLALWFPLGWRRSRQLIALLFSAAYLSYLLALPLMLAAVYPVVISYYNVVILRRLSRERELSRIAAAMLAIGWGASGAGLGAALTGGTIFVVMVVLLYGTWHLLHVSRSFHLQRAESLK